MIELLLEPARRSGCQDIETLNGVLEAAAQRQRSPIDDILDSGVVDEEPYMRELAAAFRLDEGGTAVESVRVLEARHPRTKDPTTGVIVDGEFWYILNSNLSGFDIRRDTPDPTLWGNVVILRAAL